MDEPRADVNRVPPILKSNLSKAEAQAIKELKRDKSRIALTADKGVAMVVMDIPGYINKSNYLLA